jgi:hypothetical protein
MKEMFVLSASERRSLIEDLGPPDPNGRQD